MTMNRRRFLYNSCLLYPAFTFANYCSTDTIRNQEKKIIISKNDTLQTEKRIVDSSKVISILDNAMQSLFNVDSPKEAWSQVVKPGETIGLKINCLSGRQGSTHRELIDAVCERLKEAGIKANNIIIWDRQNSDLEEAGFTIVRKGNRELYFGNDLYGFDNQLHTSGLAASLICQTLTRLCDGAISLPVLKDHGIAGVTIALKNMFGAIHNPNKYHLNVGNPYIPDVYMLPAIRSKVRLIICDALIAQYNGGPSWMPHWSWNFNGLLVGTDPVALDYTGWQIIEKKRQEMGMSTLKQANREPIYIHTAADANHRLGSNNPEQFKVVAI
jgi:uncharacterized protein (DUF362 family)